MKALFTSHFDNRLFLVHFSLELPLFPKARRTIRSSDPKVLISRSVNVVDAAEVSANINVGKTRLEMRQPSSTFRQFFLDLIVLDGFEMLVNSDRYSLTIKTGRCFEPESVCRSVAECVRRHFYPAEELVCESQLESPTPAISENDRKGITIREPPQDD